ncbi:kelch-like protein 21 [Babylonia areolata]|uniref:kelch-like protein 21 n=1 Tax=Babylonia areolata TaxID=304850 RepID=UPI003FD0EED2
MDFNMADIPLSSRSRLAAPSAGLEMFEFLFVFDRATGSPKVHYFMIDPMVPSRLFPKMNTINFKKIKDLVGYRPVVLSNCLYLIGGKDWNHGNFMAGVWKFDPRLNQWSEAKPLKLARCRFAVEALDGFIYVMGGETKNQQVTDSVERYDPLADRWTEVAPLPRARADHASCTLSGRIYVSGGISNLKHQCSNVFWSYDPIDDVWSEAVDGMMMPYEREKHNMIGVGTSKIFVLAGRGFDQETFSEKDESEVAHFNIGGHPGNLPGLKPLWDLDHPSMIHPHSNGAAVLLGRNIWVIGGLSYTKGTSIRVVTYYDIKRRRWRDAFPLPEGSFTNVDCALLSIPASNRDFCSMDRFLYDRWILW